ncbi:unnamed protein product, partial [Allacma fusca]
MKERFICCCRSGWGTVIIAVSEITMFLYAATVTSRLLTDELSTPMIQNDMSVFIEPVIKLTVSSIGLIFALLLLDGILRHIPTFMRAWIVWAVVVLFFIVFKLNLLMFHNQEMD